MDLLDDRDTSNNHSFLAIAYYFQDRYIDAIKTMDVVYNKLFKHPIFWCKNNTDTNPYKWSNCEDFRKWFYNHILKYFNYDPYCGSNFDQQEPLLIYSYVTENVTFMKKYFRGLCRKLGFCGDNIQHVLFRPEIISIFARWKNIQLLYWILDAISYPFECLTLRRPINVETTQKIRLYIRLVAYKNKPTWFSKNLSKKVDWRFWRETFGTYFSNPNARSRVIYEEMCYDLLDEVKYGLGD